MKRILEEAKRLVRSNSFTVRGTEEIANYLAGLMQDRGIHTELQAVMHSREDLSKRQFNLIGVLGDPLVDRKIRKGLLLLTHLDTVGPGLARYWTESNGRPYDMLLKEDRLTGLGVLNKLDFLCKIYAVQKFRERKLKMPIYLVGSCGDKVGMFGTRYLIESIALNPKFVLVGAPTQMKIAYAHKSVSAFKVVISYNVIDRDARGFNRRINLYSFGRTGHSAYQTGKNALVQLLEFLQKGFDNGFELQFTRIEGGELVVQVPDKAMAQFYLTSHQFEDFKRFFREVLNQKGENEESFQIEVGGLGDAGISFTPENVLPCVMEIQKLFGNVVAEFSEQSQGQDSRFKIPTATWNLGKLIQNPGRTELMFDVRLLPGQSEKDLEEKLVKGAQAIANEYPNLNVDVTKDRSSASLEIPQDNPFLKMCSSALEEAEVKPEYCTLPMATEAGLYYKKGYDTAVVGPGKGDELYAPNESILLEEIQKAIIFYETVIEQTCVAN